jgi:hypothetical protein
MRVQARHKACSVADNSPADVFDDEAPWEPFWRVWCDIKLNRPPLVAGLRTLTHLARRARGVRTRKRPPERDSRHQLAHDVVHVAMRRRHRDRQVFGNLSVAGYPAAQQTQDVELSRRERIRTGGGTECGQGLEHLTVSELTIDSAPQE